MSCPGVNVNVNQFVNVTKIDKLFRSAGKENDNVIEISQEMLSLIHI